MDQQPDRPIQFRLVHVFYLMSLLASCLAVFGPGGVLPFLVIAVFWGYVFNGRSRPKALLHACLVLLFGLCLTHCVIMVPTRSAREAGRRAQCSNNLKQIVLALHAYHDAYGQFPPACIRDKDGKPMHSWRVLILPFLEQQKLYDKYRFDEPWNGPNNRKLLDNATVYAVGCPSDTRRPGSGRLLTSYLAVVGPRTVWDDGQNRRLQGIPDGWSQTVMVVEYQGDPIEWAEPRDLELSEALDALTSTEPDAGGLHRHEDFFFEYDFGRNVARADGSVHSVCGPVPREIWSALLTVDDGVCVTETDLRRTWVGPRRLRLGNCLSLATFVLVTLLPLGWVWRKPRVPEAAS